MNKTRLALGLKLVVSGALLAFLYRRVPIDAMCRAFSHIELGFMALIVVLLFLNTTLSAWKWKILLSADGTDVPLRKLVASYLVGTFFNIFLPSSIGGDSYRIYDVARSGAGASRSFSSVLADRLSGFIALTAVALVASTAAARMTGLPLLAALPALALAGLGAGTWALVRGTPVRWAMRVFHIDRFARVAGFVEACLASFAQYARRPVVAARIMGISFLFQGLLIGCVALMGAALGIDVAFVYYCAFVPMICLLEALPISVYGIGVRDAGYVFFFGLVGLSQVETRSLALLYLATNVGYSLVGGLVFAARFFGAPRPNGRPPDTARPAMDDRHDAVREAHGAGLCRAVASRDDDQASDTARHRPSPRSRRPRRAWTAVLLTLAVWLVFSWPLPRYVNSGVPCTSKNSEKYGYRSMVAGDHLQLMYHFWLAADMLRGRTPPMMNLYEFNTGDDSSRREPGAYYFPFSAVYALVAAVGGRALGWNLTGLLSLIATYEFTRRLCRRYGGGEFASVVGAIVAVAFPFRWISLLGGSPTGFAMALVPMLFLGLDVAVRDERMRGGWLAGCAVLLAFCADLHVFFFCVLATPAWCVLAFAARDRFEWRRPRAYLRLARALLPTVALGVLAYLLSRATAGELETGVMANGWSWREVGPYSPLRKGFFRRRALGITNQIFVGYSLVAALGVGGLAALIRLPRSRPVAWRRLVVPALLGVGLLGICALALGTNGPAGGKALQAARRLIPPYAMVRQTAKIFCLVPTLTAVGAAWLIGASVPAAGHRGRAAGIAVVCLLTAAVLAEFRAQLAPSICLLEREQQTYKRVVEDARLHGRTPHVLAVPLWPGNSHWASLYQYAVSLYRVRMVNGYRPAVSSAYVENVFKPLESVNQGRLDAEQLERLRRFGVTHILVHEDAFPEQVSPFPVSATLRALRANAHLELLSGDDRVWAFRLRDVTDVPGEATDGHRAQPPPCNVVFPAWHWEGERMACTGAVARAAEQTSGGRYLALGEEGGACRWKTRAPVAAASGLRWLLRVRGHGRLSYATEGRDGISASDGVSVEGDRWTWLRLEIPADPGDFFAPGVSLTVEAGAVDLDVAYLTGGLEPILPPGGSVRIPAADFFHAGSSRAGDGSVVFLVDKDPDRVIMYGTCVGLLSGEYTASLDWSSDTSISGPLGRFRVGDVTVADDAECVVRRGSRVELRCRMEQAGALRMEFEYARVADMCLEAVRLTRVNCN